jgi:transketolase
VASAGSQEDRSPDHSSTSCVEAWGHALVSVAAQRSDVVVVVNDSISSSGLATFAERFPDRLINVGIAEQNLVSVAAGLAFAGKTVFVSSAAAFLTGRALEQIKIDIAYAGANVKLVGQSPGVGYGDLGSTHHAIEDITWMTALPGMAVVAPCNPSEMASAVRWAASSPGCVYLRVPRRTYGAALCSPADFVLGQATVLRQGSDIALLATGAATGLAAEAGDALANLGVEAHVLSISTIKPLDEAAVLDAARTTGRLITIEDGLVCGFGSQVAAVTSERHPVTVRRMGLNDRFAPVGSDTFILEQMGVTVRGIQSVAMSLLGRGGTWDGSDSGEAMER